MGNMNNQDILTTIQHKFADHILDPAEPHGLLTFTTDKEHLIDVLRFAKEELGFFYLTDITAVHYPERTDAFAVVYHVHNLTDNVRLRVKVFIDGQYPTIPSATVLWNGANWMERETYDFFGIDFDGHPDLRRILNMDELEVFPMRKEYPLEDPNRVDKKDFYFGR